METQKRQFTSSLCEEKGAVYVEATIVLPLFFLFLLGLFDITMIMQQRFAVTDSLRTTARFLSTQVADCDEQATRSFDLNLNNASVLARVQNPQLSQPILETQNGVRGVRLSVDVDYTCIFCFLTFRALSPNLTATVFVPVESNEICTRVGQTT